MWAQSRGPQSARDALPLLRPRFLPLHPAHLFLSYKYESPFHPHLLLFPFYSTPHRQILYEREREREKILILGENCGRVRRVSSSLLPEASVSRPPPSFPPLSIYSLGNLFGRVGFGSVDRSIDRASERRLVSRYAPPIRCDFEFLTTVS